MYRIVYWRGGDHRFALTALGEGLYEARGKIVELVNILDEMYDLAYEVIIEDLTPGHQSLQVNEALIQKTNIEWTPPPGTEDGAVHLI